MKPISLQVQTLYSELIEQCRSATGIYGSVYETGKGAQKYAYVRAAVGQSRHDTYLGKVGTPATELVRQEILDAKQAIKTRQTLVQMLRRQLPAPHAQFGKVLRVLEWGGFLEQSVVVGTSAFTCYPALVGWTLDEGVMGTEDADLATLNFATRNGEGDDSIEKLLKRADATFRPLPSLDKKALPSQFRSANGFRVDLLTQMRSTKSDSAVPLPGWEASAMPLQHLAWLVKEPAQAVVLARTGILIDIPQPARFAVHKLIVAQKRNASERLKRRKDLLQAKSLLVALRESDPFALADVMRDAMAQGRKGWALPIKKSLEEIGLENNTA